MKKTIYTNGFALFSVLIAMTLVAIVAVVGYVLLKKPRVAENLPSPYVATSPAPTVTTTMTFTESTATPAPTVSTSTDVEIIGKELNDTKINSTDADFKELNTSASSL